MSFQPVFAQKGKEASKTIYAKLTLAKTIGDTWN
jgi:hypothetical protein